MEKEIKKEELANPAAKPENNSVHSDPIIREINDAKNVSMDAMQDELEEIKKTLKQG